MRTFLRWYVTLGGPAGDARPAGLAIAMAGLAAAVIFIDQLTKLGIRVALATCPDGPIEACERIALAGPIGLLRTTNPSSALGLADPGSIVPVLLAGGFLLATQATLIASPATRGIAIGLQLGGLLANLIDRVLFGSVIDFVHVQTGGAGQGVVLNPADVGLVVGAAIAARAIIAGHRANDRRSAGLRR
jgi:lipoprotein signal peptidase